MELPDHSMTVPEGISIAPAHFLTAPDDDFREHIEGNNHEHHIIKIIVNNGNLEMRLFGSFTMVEDRFSFATPELHNEKLCFLTTGILNKLLFGPDPTCNHGNTKTFVVSRKIGISPHIDRALAVTLFCEDHADNASFLQEHFLKFEEVCLDHGKYPWDQLTPNKEYDMNITSGEATMKIPFSFSFYLLCKYNGKLRLGNIDSKLLNVSCKRPVPISFDIISGKYFHPFSIHLRPCEREEDCSMVQDKKAATQIEVQSSLERKSRDEMKGGESSPTMAQNFHGERHTASGGNFILGDTTYNIHQIAEVKRKGSSPKVIESKP